MAIKPVDERLDDILPPQSSLIKEEPAAAAGTPEMAEPVQLAGVGSLVDLIKFGKQLTTKGDEIRAAKEAAKAVDVQPVDTPPGVEGAPKTEPLTDQPLDQKNPIKPQPPDVVTQVKTLDDQLQVIEDTIGDTPSTGKPPEQLMNVDRIDGPEDYKQAVNALVNSSGVQIKTRTWDATIADAKARGLGDNIIKELEGLRQQYAEMPVDMVRMRLATYQNNREFYDLAKRSYLEPDNMDLKAQLLFKLNLQNQLNATYISMRTAAAQATAAGGIQITPDMAKGMIGTENIRIPGVNSDNMKKMLSDPQVDQNLKVLVEKFVQLSDEGSREGLLNKVSKVGLVKELWYRTWQMGLLSGTGTHMVNLVSNATFLASSVATRALAGSAGVLSRGLGGKAEVEMGEAAAMMAGMVHFSRDALKLGWEAGKTGTTREMREGQSILSDAGTKIEGSDYKFDVRDYGVENEWAVKGLNGWSTFVTLLGGRPIMAIDDVFKTLGYRAELYAQSYREAAQAERAALAAGKSADQAKEAGLKRMGEILTEPPDQIDEAAKDFSQMVTFSRKLTGLSAQVQELATNNLLGRIMLPFIKAPVWVGSESMQHSPFAFASKQWREDVKAGGAKRELAMAKMGMGSILMLSVGSYVADGRITGGGPGDNNLRRRYYEGGWRPYSFVFNKDEWDEDFVSYLHTMNEMYNLGLDPSVGANGKLYVPFRGIDPVAGPLAMAADAVEYARYEEDQGKINQVILGAAWGLYSYVGQLPFLTTVSSLGGAFTATIPNVKYAFRSAIDNLAQTMTTFVLDGSPVGVFNAARRQVERLYDPMSRMTAESPDTPIGLKGVLEGMNKFRAGTPGLSEDLPLLFDWLGEPKTDLDPSSPWIAGITGVRLSESKQRPADKVIAVLGIPIQPPGMNLSVGGVTIPLQPEEYEYMMQALGTAKQNGLSVGDYIWKVYSQPGFLNTPKDAQQEAILEAYGKFKEAAKGALLTSEFKPEIDERVKDAQQKRIDMGKYVK